jgi:deoxyribose-phosphate aldolase
MIIEYENHDISVNHQELKNQIIEACKYMPNSISVLPQNLKLLKDLLGEEFQISCPIDSPLGSSDISSRSCMIEYAIKNKVNQLDIMLPTHFVCNRKYVKLREDIENAKKISINENIRIRYILEYRVFNEETLHKVCQILAINNIYDIMPSSGFRLDNIYDNILAASIINKKNKKMNITVNGNIWNEKHIDDIIKLKLYGIRVNSVNALELFQKKN